MAMHKLDKQPFHMIPDGLPTFERSAAALIEAAAGTDAAPMATAELAT